MPVPFLSRLSVLLVAGVLASAGAFAAPEHKAKQALDDRADPSAPVGDVGHGLLGIGQIDHRHDGITAAC